MPLFTGQTEQEMLEKTIWYDDWLYKRQQIFSKKRNWTVNIYHRLLDGQEEITAYRTNSIHYTDMKPVLEYIIDQIPTDLKTDWENSYLTISC